jgi:hypothetical protein
MTGNLNAAAPGGNVREHPVTPSTNIPRAFHILAKPTGAAFTDYYAQQSCTAGRNH